MRSLQARLLLTVGLLATCTAIAIAVATRRDTRREFLRYQEIERRATTVDVPGGAAAVAARLDGRCCDAGVMNSAQAELPRTMRVVVVDDGGGLVATAVPPGDALAITATRMAGDVLTFEATRDDGATREQLLLQVRAKGAPVRLASGQTVRLFLLPVPDAAKLARADAFLGRVDQRLLWLTGVISVLALDLTWLVARSTVTPLAALRYAAESLAAGRTVQRVPEEGPSEVRALAVTFNALATQLEEQHQLRRALTSDVVHELRTPLTAFQCRLDGIIDGVIGDPVAVCTALHADVRHLSRLVDDLQDIALAEAREIKLAVEPVSLRRVADDARRLAGLDADARLEVDVEADVSVTADPRRLSQVFVNLLTNASQHGPPAGSIRLRARSTGDRVHVEVENVDGRVPEPHIPRLFDRFYRVDPSRQRATGGTGLGLAIVKHLVEAHDGVVAARNTATGFVVSVDLPRAGRVR